MSARPVLLIDEDTQWCARVCQYLEAHGIAAVSAVTVDAAARALEHIGKPGAFLMDIDARGASGPAVSLLRDTAPLRDVPIGYLRKSAALDALLFMLSSSAPAQNHAA
jgi:DNA-binding response OmpR family regulator